MNAVRKRLTYANVMSSIAVFLVLGGATAFAASNLGKNSVGSKQLKKNAVTAAKLKKNAVTGAKIKPGSVTGAKIDESTLGPVPSAATAVSAATATTAKTADSANSAGTANLATNLSGYSHNSIRLAPTPVADYNAGINGAVETTLLTSGPLSVVAKCFTYSGTVYAIALIKSATDGSAFQSYSDQSYGSNLLGPSTPAGDRELTYESSSGSYSSYKGNYYGTYGASATDGTTVNGQVQLGVKTGNLTGSQGVYGPGNVCLFAGNMFTL